MQTLPQDARESARAADRVFDVLVDRIVSGALRPGDSLGEQALARTFDVSRTPVREALQRLNMAGLAERGPRRVFSVSRFDIAKLRDLFEAMGEIEAVCAEYCARRMGLQEKMELAGIVAAGARSAESDDIDGFRKLNVRFHQALFEGAHNRALEQMAQQVRILTTPYRDVQFRISDRLRSSQVEHELILAAIQKEDPEEARRAMRAHIASSAMVVNQISPDGGADPLMPLA